MPLGPRVEGLVDGFLAFQQIGIYVCPELDAGLRQVVEQRSRPREFRGLERVRGEAGEGFGLVQAHQDLDLLLVVAMDGRQIRRAQIGSVSSCPERLDHSQRSRSCIAGRDRDRQPD